MSTEKIRIKIDLLKLEREHLYLASAGKEYLDATLIPSKDSKYGDSHFIVQDVGREKREAGVKGRIIGNAKILGGFAPKPAAQPATKTTTHYKEDTSSIPF